MITATRVAEAADGASAEYEASSYTPYLVSCLGGIDYATETAHWTIQAFARVSVLAPFARAITRQRDAKLIHESKLSTVGNAGRCPDCLAISCREFSTHQARARSQASQPVREAGEESE
jgi:hypothetical protein